MRSILFLVALLGAVSAQNKWPMISVNSAGEIVLQSLTRAQSFVFTPLTVNTAPTTGSASATTAQRLASGPTFFRVLVPSGVVASHGVTLPTPVVGQTITLLQSDSTFTAYTLWVDSGISINSDSGTQSYAVSNRRTLCVAVLTTRWDCSDAVAGSLVTNSVTASTGNLAISSTAGAVSITSATGTSITSTLATQVTAGTTSTYTSGTGTTVTSGALTSVTSATGTSIGAATGGVTIQPTVGAITLTGAAAGVSITGAAGGISLNGGAGNLKYTGTFPASAAVTNAPAMADANSRLLCVVSVATGVIGVCADNACAACAALI